MAARRRAQRATTTHHDRCAWYYERAAFPLRDAPPTELEQFWAQHEKYTNIPGLTWEEAGPTNIAGRVTALAIHPGDNACLFAGSAGGGVWMTADGGSNWRPIWKKTANQNIGALAIHPTAPKRLICATGEANLSPDSYPGSGVYFSDDTGTTWRNFFFDPNKEKAGPAGMTAQTGIPRRIGTIAFDPNDQLNFALGSVTHDERMPAGLFLYDKRLGLQPCTHWGRRSYNCHSVVFHPRREGVVFAAVEPRGTANGIWRTTDGGRKWEQLKNGLPSGDLFGRTTLALAPSEPDTLYAVAADRRRVLLGIYVSKDMGDTWQEIGGGRFAKERFMSYNSTIAVHPDDPGFVIWGGINLYRTKDGGKHWRRITSTDRGARNYAHADHHALIITRAGLVYSGNDGGVALSENGGDTWTMKSNGMVTTMFYDVDVAPTNSKVFGGGTQDNGTLIAGISGKPGQFTPVLGGDGGWMVFDPADEEHVFASYQNMHIFRHRRGESWEIGTWTDVTPKEIDEAERRQRAIAVLAIEPGRRQAAKKVYAGSSRLWMTGDDGASWRPVSHAFDGSVISAIEVSEANPAVIFVGTTKGGIYRSTDGGESWSENLSSGEIPGRLVTRIETHPKMAEAVVVTVASSGALGANLIRTDNRSAKCEECLRPYSHVFFSDDMGTTWQDLDAGALPNVVYHAAVFETRPPYRLFVAGDTGVWVVIQDGWMSISGNLPNVVISDLVYQHEDQVLTAATYGRGIWRLDLAQMKFGL